MHSKTVPEIMTNYLTNFAQHQTLPDNLRRRRPLLHIVVIPSGYHKISPDRSCYTGPSVIKREC